MYRRLSSLAILSLLTTTFTGCFGNCDDTRAGKNTQLMIRSMLSDSLRPNLQIALLADFGSLRVYLPQNWRDTTIHIPLEMANYPLSVAAIYRFKFITDSIIISSDSSYSILWIDTLKPKEKSDTLPINGKNYIMKYESLLTHCL